MILFIRFTCDKTMSEMSGTSDSDNVDPVGKEAVGKDAKHDVPFLELPEVLLYAILKLVAGPTHRTHVICHQLVPLSKHVASTLLDKSPTLWQALLEGDYGVKEDIKHTANTRRAKRRKESPLLRVKDAHLMIKDNTEIAYFHLEEMSNSSQSPLTRSRLNRLMHEYGPQLRINDRATVGGTFLVTCCRARHVRESIIRKCVELLVEEYGANVNLCTYETSQSTVTPLAVAAARGMPSVVMYLFDRGASCAPESTGRFRLHTNSRKTVNCSRATPLEFSRRMRAAEVEAGANVHDVKDLDKCIRYLSTRDAKRLDL